MLMVSMMASAQDSFAKQFKGKEGFSCVTIGKAAMKMMSSRGTLGREGFSGKLKIGNFADKVDRLEIVAASTPQASEELAKACNEWIEKDNFESIIDVATHIMVGGCGKCGSAGSSRLLVPAQLFKFRQQAASNR